MNGNADGSMMTYLHKRFASQSMGASRYVVAEDVPSQRGSTGPVVDFVALDLWHSELAFHGHEIIRSRADWLVKLRNPLKAAATKRYMNYWWLVVTDPLIVKGGELPDDWGLLALTARRLRVVKAPQKLKPEVVPRTYHAAFARAVQKTASSEEFARLSVEGRDRQIKDYRLIDAALRWEIAKLERQSGRAERLSGVIGEAAAKIQEPATWGTFDKDARLEGLRMRLEDVSAILSRGKEGAVSQSAQSILDTERTGCGACRFSSGVWRSCSYHEGMADGIQLAERRQNYAPNIQNEEK